MLSCHAYLRRPGLFLGLYQKDPKTLSCNLTVYICIRGSAGCCGSVHSTLMDWFQQILLLSCRFIIPKYQRRLLAIHRSLSCITGHNHQSGYIILFCQCITALGIILRFLNEVHALTYLARHLTSVLSIVFTHIPYTTEITYCTSPFTFWASVVQLHLICLDVYRLPPQIRQQAAKSLPSSSFRFRFAFSAGSWSATSCNTPIIQFVVILDTFLLCVCAAQGWIQVLHSWGK